jgi:diguanylate cyclase (GGDEF)-like protein/PAS domain S-box-containing protein
LARSDAIGLSLSETIIPPEQRQAHVRGLARLIASGEGPIMNRRVEMIACKADGATFPVELAVWIGVAEDQPEFSAFIHDISERKQAEAKLHALHEELRVSARTDPLTGLGNRLRLDEDLAGLHARSERYGYVYAVALLDIDFFKLYNDSCGHLAGDEALRQVAAVIVRAARSGDTVYRYGGEEIVCIFPDQSLQTALIAAERLRTAVAELRISHPHPSTSGVLTISVGVASQCVTRPRSIAALLQAADDALYLAKQRGRNRVCTTPPPPPQAVDAR